MDFALEKVCHRRFGLLASILSYFKLCWYLRHADVCCDGRVVKALDLKSNGIFPRRFEPCSQRSLFGIHYLLTIWDINVLCPFAVPKVCTADSSVGRAGDCSWIKAISRSLVQIRFGGIYFYTQTLTLRLEICPHFNWCTRSDIIYLFYFIPFTRGGESVVFKDLTVHSLLL